MSWGNAVYKCNMVAGYPQAVRYFNETSKPRGKKWDDHERPLYNTACHHYRIERGPDGAYYDMVLYKTAMARYMRPEDDGSYVTLLRGWNTTASWKFLSSVCSKAVWYHGLSTTQATTVVLPLNPYCPGMYEAENRVVVPAQFSAKLHFTEDDKLMLNRSAHRPIFARHSSESDLRNREEFNAKHETLLDLMVMRMPTFNDAYSYDYRVAKPFRSAGIRVRPFVNGELEPERLAVFSQEVYNVLRSKQFYSSNGEDDVPPTTKEFRAALLRALYKEGGFDRRNEHVELPQFPDKLPRYYYWS